MLEILMSSDVRMVIAGACGGAVSWIVRKVGVKEGAGTVAVGAICSLYLWPLSQPIIESVFGDVVADEIQLQRISGFAMGIGGVSVTGLLLDAFRYWGRQKGKADD